MFAEDGNVLMQNKLALTSGNGHAKINYIKNYVHCSCFEEYFGQFFFLLFSAVAASFFVGGKCGKRPYIYDSTRNGGERSKK